MASHGPGSLEFCPPFLDQNPRTEVCFEGLVTVHGAEVKLSEWMLRVLQFGFPLRGRARH